MGLTAQHSPWRQVSAAAPATLDITAVPGVSALLKRTAALDTTVLRALQRGSPARQADMALSSTCFLPPVKEYVMRAISATEVQQRQHMPGARRDTTVKLAKLTPKTAHQVAYAEKLLPQEASIALADITALGIQAPRYLARPARTEALNDYRTRVVVAPAQLDGIA